MLHVKGRINYHGYGTKSSDNEWLIKKSYWPKVVNWNIYIFKRSPILTIQDKTLEKACNK